MSGCPANVRKDGRMYGKAPQNDFQTKPLDVEALHLAHVCLLTTIVRLPFLSQIIKVADL